MSARFPVPGLILPILVIALPAASAAEAGDPLEAVARSTNAWIELRAETVRLETAWVSEQALLQSSLAAIEHRATEAEEKRDLVVARTAREREEVTALEDQVRQARERQRASEARLEALSARLVSLRPALPPRLADALEVSLKSLSRPDLAPGERLQLVVSVLNRCAQFNREVTWSEEILSPEPGAEPRLHEVIYWGLSHAYALDRVAGRAWFGTPGPQGWRWESRPELAEPAARLIAIHKGDADPDFVAAPARVEPTSATPSATEAR